MTLLFVIDLDPMSPVPDEDIENVLQPDSFEVIIRVTSQVDATMEALAARAGVFPSRGQARKNGFAGPIPHGFEVFGASGKSFFVWNPRPPSSPATIGRKRHLTDQWFAFLDAMRATGVPGSWSIPDMVKMREEWSRRRRDGTWETPFSQAD